MRSVHEASSAGTPTSNLFMLRMASGMAPPGLPIAALASSCRRRLRSMPVCVCAAFVEAQRRFSAIPSIRCVCFAVYLGPELQGLWMGAREAASRNASHGSGPKKKGTTRKRRPYNADDV